MALKKATTTSEGFSIDYWRIHPAITVDFETRTAVGRLVAYKDEASRRGGKDPIQPHRLSVEKDVFELSGTELDTALLTGDVRAAMYAQVKAQDFFSTAEDV